MAMESKDYQRCHSIADPTFRRVIQDDWLLPKLADWMARLEEEVAPCVAPPVLAAHSLACSLVAHWSCPSPKGGPTGRRAQEHPKSVAKTLRLVGVA